MTQSNEYQLAEKMRNRFRGRGASVSGMQASSTSELMKRAQMGGDPSVNCSELDFRNGVRVNRRPNPQATNRRPPYANDPGMAGRTHSENVHARPATARPTSTTTGTQTKNKARPASAYTGEGTSLSRQKKASVGKTVKKNKIKNTRSKAKPTSGPEELREVETNSRRITPTFVVFVTIGMMMLMSIVVSYSEIYQVTNDIAQLENTLATLKDTAAELELELEERNDIRVIEQIATEKLGMVKEDAVQRKYLSLSDGERIDVIEDETDTETPSTGILLSSIWSSLGDLLDYFR